MNMLVCGPPRGVWSGGDWKGKGREAAAWRQLSPEEKAKEQEEKEKERGKEKEKKDKGKAKGKAQSPSLAPGASQKVSVVPHRT